MTHLLLPYNDDNTIFHRQKRNLGIYDRETKENCGFFVYEIECNTIIEIKSSDLQLDRGNPCLVHTDGYIG